MGFIETPYSTSNKGKVDLKSEPIYLSAEEEDDNKIAQAKADLLMIKVKSPLSV
jgi:DNA-directed RNA polymerase subunit beta